MNPDLATELHTTMSKHTRFSDDPSPPSALKTTAGRLRSPKEVAAAYTQGIFALLNPKLATILKKTSDNHLTILHKLFKKKRQYK